MTSTDSSDRHGQRRPQPGQSAADDQHVGEEVRHPLGMKRNQVARNAVEHAESVLRVNRLSVGTARGSTRCLSATQRPRDSIVACACARRHRRQFALFSAARRALRVGLVLLGVFRRRAGAARFLAALRLVVARRVALQARGRAGAGPGCAGSRPARAVRLGALSPGRVRPAAASAPSA